MPIINSLLRRFLFLSFGVVEDEGGGAAVAEDEQEDEAQGGVSEEGAADAASDAGDAAEDEGVIITIGDEPAAEDEQDNKAPSWVRDLRKQNREKDRAIRQLQDELRTLKTPTATTLGAKPTLVACDYDEERFAAELEAWTEAKRKADSERNAAEEAQRKQVEAWNQRLQAYQEAKTRLKVPDFDDAEETLKASFSDIQHKILIAGAKDAALLSYAISKNPTKLKELQAITDPVQFAWAAAQLEAQVKLQPRRQAPLPESRLSGAGPLAGTANDELAKLQKEADRTGDRSKVAAYLRRQQQAQAA